MGGKPLRDIFEAIGHGAAYDYMFSLVQNNFLSADDIDGNGRICRLSMNAALLQNGYPPAIIPPILRGDYIRTLEKFWTNERFFVEFIAERVL